MIIGSGLCISVLVQGQAISAQPNAYRFVCPVSVVSGQEVRLSGSIVVTHPVNGGDSHLDVELQGNLPALNLKEALNVPRAQSSKSLSLRFIPKNYDEDAFVNLTLSNGVSQIGLSPAHVNAHDWKGPKNHPVRELIAADCAYSGEIVQ